MSLLIAFSGQGLQHADMFKILINDDYGTQWLKEASQIINLDLFDRNVVQHYCNDAIYVQLLIVILSIGSYHAITKQTPLNPHLLCGYSLGELSAFGVSAGLSLKDLCSITYKRAELMQQATAEIAAGKSCGLVALKGTINQNTAQLLATRFDCPIAIINAADHYIFGGLSTHLDALLEEARLMGVIKTKALAVQLPSHTPMLIKATTEFFNYLQTHPQYSMQIPVLNTLTNELIDNTTDMITVLANELSQMLHWNKVIQLAPEYGIDFLLELGPGKALKNMFSAQPSKIKAYSLEDFSTINGLSHFIKKYGTG